MTVSASDRKSVQPIHLTSALSRSEAVLATALAVLIVLSVIISALKAQQVAWSDFTLSLLPALGLFLVGTYIRLFKTLPRIAKLAIANSLFLGFIGLTSLVIYLRFPIAKLSVDQQLLQIDAMFGYSWPDFVNGIAAYPAIGSALQIVYYSSLIQLFAMILFLALSGRSARLDRALMAGSLSLLLTTLIWWLAPSVGPSVFFDIPREVQDSIRLVTNDNYAGLLHQLSDQGLAIITPSDIVGTIAFPSYHTVMALLVVWYLRGTIVFLPALALNIAMVPAILSHGGHHLTDMFGGVLVFAIAAYIAARPWFGRATN